MAVIAIVIEYATVFWGFPFIYFIIDKAETKTKAVPYLKDVFNLHAFILFLIAFLACLFLIILIFIFINKFIVKKLKPNWFSKIYFSIKEYIAVYILFGWLIPTLFYFFQKTGEKYFSYLNIIFEFHIIYAFSSIIILLIIFIPISIYKLIKFIKGE